MITWNKKGNTYALYRNNKKLATVQLLKSFDSPETEHYDCLIFPCTDSENFKMQLRFDRGYKDWKTFQKIVNHIITEYRKVVDHISLEKYYSYQPNETGILAYLLLKGNRVGHISYTPEKRVFHLEIPQDFTVCRSTIIKEFSADTGSIDLRIENNPKAMQQMLSFVEHVYAPEIFIEKSSASKTLILSEENKDEYIL